MTVTAKWTDPSEGGPLDRDTGQTIREQDWDGVLGNLLMLGGSSGSIAKYNLLTNGGMEIWQRGAGPFSATGAWTADRWQLNVTGAPAISVARITSTMGSPGYSIDLAHNSTPGNWIALTQVLRDHFPQLAGKTVTFAVTCKGSGTTTAGVYRLGLYDAVGARAFSAYNTTASGVERLTLTYAIAPTATTLAAEIFLDGAPASGIHVEVNDATLVVGSVAADYAPLHPADEVARCLRYYEILGNGTVDIFGVGQATGTNSYVPIRYKARKAVNPTITYSGPGNFSMMAVNAVAVPCTAVATSSANADMVQVVTTVASGLVGGNASQFWNSTASGFIAIEANP